LRFSEAFIQKVVQSNDIVRLISRHTEFKHSGPGLMGRCPFPDHPEKTGSFSVSPTKQVYHCFGCLKSGNIITFLKDFNGLSFYAAIEYLAQEAGLELPRESVSPKEIQQYEETKTLKEKIKKAYDIANRLYQKQLQDCEENSGIKNYLKKRALTEESIQKFQLGYATPDWSNLKSVLKESGLSEEVGLKAELVRQNYDFFRSRLIFPIHDNLGQVIAFGGRILDEGQPKYLNSPETPIFQKSKTLYGLFHGAKYLRSQDSAVLVEGYMDVIALHQAGIPIALAPMGTSLTLEQARIIRQSTKNVVVLFDGDQAGQNAAIRALPLLFQADLLPKGLFLPDDLDPDDFIQQFGAESLKALISKAPDLFTSLLQKWMNGYRGHTTEKLQLSEKVSPILESIKDPKLRLLYEKETAWRLGVPENWWRSFKKTQKKQDSAGSSPWDQTTQSTPLNQPGQSPQAPPQSRELPQKAHQPGHSPNQGGDVTFEITVTDSSQSMEGEATFFFSLSQLHPHELKIVQMMLNYEECWHLGWSLEVLPLLHNQAQRVLEKTQELTRQEGVKFDSVVSLLSSYVENPEMLFMDTVLQKFYETQAEEDTFLRYFKDLVKKIQDQYLLRMIDNIKLQLKSQFDQNLFEKLNQFIKIRQSHQKLEVGPLKIH
jgi:DNA primase